MSSAQTPARIERFDLHYDPVEKEPFAHPSPTGEFVRYSDVARLSALEPGEAAQPVAWQYRVMFDLGHARENEWCDWHDTRQSYFDTLNAEIANGRTRIQTRALYATPITPPSPAVTDAMVEAAYDAFTQSFASSPIGTNNTRNDLRAALSAALSHPADGWRLVPLIKTARKAVQDVEYICSRWEKNQGASSLTVSVRALIDAISALPVASLDGPIEQEIDRLRLKAFETNSEHDRKAYFEAASKWFQGRHFRNIDQAAEAE